MMEDIEPIVYEAPEGWYVIKRHRTVGTNYAGLGHCFVGMTRTIRPRKGAAKIRVRVKEMARFRYNERFFHVVSDRDSPITRERRKLYFKTLDEAVAAGNAIDSFESRGPYAA